MLFTTASPSAADAAHNADAMLLTPRPPTEPCAAAAAAVPAALPPADTFSFHQRPPLPTPPHQPPFFVTQLPQPPRGASKARYTTPGGAVLVPEAAGLPAWVAAADTLGDRQRMSVLTALRNLAVKEHLSLVHSATRWNAGRTARQQALVTASHALRDARSDMDAIDDTLRDLRRACYLEQRPDTLPQSEAAASAALPQIRPRRPPGGRFGIEAIVARIDTESEAYRRHASPAPPPDESSFIVRNKHMDASPRRRRLLRARARERRAAVSANKAAAGGRRQRSRQRYLEKMREDEAAAAVRRRYQHSDLRRAAEWAAACVLSEASRRLSAALEDRARERSVVRLERRVWAIAQMRILLHRRLKGVRFLHAQNLSSRLKQVMTFVLCVRANKKRLAARKVQRLLTELRDSTRAVRIMLQYRERMARCGRVIRRHLRQRRCQLSVLSLKWESLWEQHFPAEPPLPEAAVQASLKAHLRDRASLCERLQALHEKAGSLQQLPHVPLFPTDARMKTLIKEAREKLQETELCKTLAAGGGSPRARVSPS